MPSSDRPRHLAAVPDLPDLAEEVRYPSPMDLLCEADEVNPDLLPQPLDLPQLFPGGVTLRRALSDLRLVPPFDD